MSEELQSLAQHAKRTPGANRKITGFIKVVACTFWNDQPLPKASVAPLLALSWLLHVDQYIPTYTGVRTSLSRIPLALSGTKAIVELLVHSLLPAHCLCAWSRCCISQEKSLITRLRGRIA